ncbi:MAG: HD domain-containing protein [Candidatus Falkowbacteria bacterium]
MNNEFNKIKELVEEELKECPGHNIDHVMRVYNLCLHIAEYEDVNLEVLQIAALLHDIGGAKETSDPTGKTDHAVESAKMAEPILKDINFSEEKIKHI